MPIVFSSILSRSRSSIKYVELCFSISYIANSCRVTELLVSADVHAFTLGHCEPSVFRALFVLSCYFNVVKIVFLRNSFDDKTVNYFSSQSKISVVSQL